MAVFVTILECYNPKKNRILNYGSFDFEKVFVF